MQLPLLPAARRPVLVNIRFTQRSSGRFITEDTAVIGEAKRTLARQHIEQFMASMKKLGYTREEIIALLESGEEEDKNGSML